MKIDEQSMKINEKSMKITMKINEINEKSMKSSNMCIVFHIFLNIFDGFGNMCIVFLNIS